MNRLPMNLYRLQDWVTTRMRKRFREGPTSRSGKSKKKRSDHADINVLSRSFRTASLGVLTPRCNHSRTLVTVKVCVTELMTFTSS